jgi:hypothetical protein
MLLSDAFLLRLVLGVGSSGIRSRTRGWLSGGTTGAYKQSSTSSARRAVPHAAGGGRERRADPAHRRRARRARVSLVDRLRDFGAAYADIDLRLVC